jgi:hypothetical protein
MAEAACGGGNGNTSELSAYFFISRCNARAFLLVIKKEGGDKEKGLVKH